MCRSNAPLQNRNKCLDTEYRVQAKHELIGDVRGIGLLLGIELVTDRATKERAYDAAEQVLYAALERGLSFKVCDGSLIHRD